MISKRGSVAHAIGFSIDPGVNPSTQPHAGQANQKDDVQELACDGILNIMATKTGQVTFRDIK